MIRPCKEFLGFDDRRLMWLGIPIISMVMPFMMNVPLESPGDYWFHALPESIFFTIGFWLFYRWSIILLRRRYPSFGQTQKRVWLTVGVILVSAPVLKIIFGGIIIGIFTLFGIHEHTLPGYWNSLFMIYLPSFMIVAIYEAMYFFDQYKTSIVEREVMQRAHVQAELDNLRNQINPHFLFNSLNTLMNLIPKDPDSAMAFLGKLSQFYRYTVGQSDQVKIPLSKELEHAKLYVDLLEERFRDGIDIRFEEIRNGAFDILPMSLQLLIENAVKHNIVSAAQPLTVDIRLGTDGDSLVVENNLQKKIGSVRSTGMGLQNITRRYAYFTDRTVEIKESDEAFSVTLPLIPRS